MKAAGRHSPPVTWRERPLWRAGVDRHTRGPGHESADFPCRDHAIRWNPETGRAKRVAGGYRPLMRGPSRHLQFPEAAPGRSWVARPSGRRSASRATAGIRSPGHFQSYDWPRSRHANDSEHSRQKPTAAQADPFFKGVAHGRSALIDMRCRRYVRGSISRTDAADAERSIEPTPCVGLEANTVTAQSKPEGFPQSPPQFVLGLRRMQHRHALAVGVEQHHRPVAGLVLIGKSLPVR